MMNIQSKNSDWNVSMDSAHHLQAYFKLFNDATVSGKGHYARGSFKARVVPRSISWSKSCRKNKMELGVILTDAQNDFLFVVASRMEELKN
ncbi:hypothetical protein Tco_0200458 [Tanacetum coccineum]